MKAWELQALGLEHVALSERPEPKPGPREVLVALRAVALNPRDLQIVLGYYPLPRELPLVLCSDGAGEVVAVGEGVTRVAEGDRVVSIPAQKWLSGPRTDAKWASTLGADLDGVLREYVVLHEDGVVRVPDHLSDAEAAALPIAGVTAWNALAVPGGLVPGQTVLVQGTGGVSMFALQFAKLAGARVIIVSRTAEKLERARAAGADETVDESAADWDARVRELTDGAGVDLVVEVTGQFERSVRCLRIGGAISQIGYMASTRLEADVFPLLLSNARLYGIVGGSRDDFEQMNRAIAFHRLRPVVDRVFEFEEVAAAFRHMADGDYSGKIIVRV